MRDKLANETMIIVNLLLLQLWKLIISEITDQWSNLQQ